MTRPRVLTHLIDATRVALTDVEGEPAKAAARRIFSALERPAEYVGADPLETLESCRHLDMALSNARAGPAPIAALADAFEAAQPLMSWQRRADAEAHGDSFYHGHANTWLVGPDAPERRDDVIVGASLVAPGVDYPEHNHAPEELYVVMSEGQWYAEDRGWYTPGVGGIVYHTPGVTHAMRSGATPLFAIWCLWCGESQS
ncbi:MAG: dimethylsulfonioproprionate lyase family protein [Gammaproteobacteria bacterium]